LTPNPPFLRKRGSTSTTEQQHDDGSGGGVTVTNMDDSFTKVKTPGHTFHHDLYDFVPGSIPHSAIVALTIGIVCGTAAYLYYTCLEWALRYLWQTLPARLFPQSSLLPLSSSLSDEDTGSSQVGMMMTMMSSSRVLWIPLVIFGSAIAVGMSVRLLGEPGDLPSTIQCVHETAYVSMDHVLPMVVASQFSILGGGSLGPEAPLVAICAALGGFVSQQVFGITDRNLVRKHTLMGVRFVCFVVVSHTVATLVAVTAIERFG
jgi:H+/Cl- antiporter ClcA